MIITANVYWALNKFQALSMLLAHLIFTTTLHDRYYCVIPTLQLNKLKHKVVKKPVQSHKWLLSGRIFNPKQLAPEPTLLTSSPHNLSPETVIVQKCALKREPPKRREVGTPDLLTQPAKSNNRT